MLTIPLRFTTGCPSAKSTAATHTLPSAHGTRPRLCDSSTSTDLHPGTDGAHRVLHAMPLQSMLPFPQGHGVLDPSPPSLCPRQEAQRREKRTWSARKIQLRLRRGSCRPGQVQGAARSRRRGPPGAVGSPPARHGAMGAAGGAGEAAPCVREGATYQPVCPALCLPSPLLPLPVVLSVPARPRSWKWDGKSPGSPQRWGARCLRSQKQRQHLAVTPAAPAGALWQRGAFLPQLGSDCALCTRSRAQKRGINKNESAREEARPSEAAAQAGSILLLPAAGGTGASLRARAAAASRHAPGPLPGCLTRLYM